MKAIVFDAPGAATVLRLGESEKPVVKEEYLLVKVMATALNRADTLQRMGKYPPPQGASKILGLEMAGTVIAVGEKVNGVQTGDRVCALLDGGGYAEYALVHEDMLISMPDEMSFEEAAAIPEVFLTAYQSLVQHMNLQSGETILIHAGASGVGTAAIQIAKAIGAHVIVTASESKHTLCKELGADLVIDYKKQSFKEVIQGSDYQAVHAILDVVAGSNFSDNLDIMKLDGRMVMLAALGGMISETANVAQIVWKRLRLMGSTLRSRDPQYKVKLTKDFIADFWPAFRSSQMKAVIHQVMPWTEVVKAHQLMEANENAGKIVLRVE